jgi:adenosylcobinamide-GDP ribazoletransferase
MIRPLHLFLCALQFLTRLPTPALTAFTPVDVARSAIYYPVVGWIVGAIAASALLAADRLWTPLIGAALSTVAGLVVTGGFHEDGLADTADGLGGGRTPEARLEIMKDSRIGAFGSMALWSALTVKTLAALALILAHGGARALPAVVMTGPYAGDPGRSKLGAGQVRRHEAVIAAALAFLPFMLASEPQAIVSLLWVIGGCAIVAIIAHRLIGGWTGDVLGAVEQVGEVAILLGLCIGPKP